MSRVARQRGARLIYPNGFHMPRRSVRILALLPRWSGLEGAGRGTVTPDAQQVAPNPGVEIYEFTGAMAAPPNLAPGTGPNRGGKKDGDPVDLYTGLFVLQKTDIALPDVMPIALTRTYRPADSRSRAFGIGASHPFDLFLVGSTFPYTYLDLVFEDGGRVHFDRTNCGQICDNDFANAQYSALTTPTDWYAANIHWNGAGWTLTKKDGMVYRFPDGFVAGSPQQAALIGITDRFGNTVTLTRDTNHNLAQVRSPNGRFLNVTYDPSNSTRIAQVQDNIGRTVGYEYDASGRLWKVTDPEGGVTEYTYDAAHRMQTLKDPRGIIYLMNQYDGTDRVIKQVLPDGGTYQCWSMARPQRHIGHEPSGHVTQTTLPAPGT